MFLPALEHRQPALMWFHLCVCFPLYCRFHTWICNLQWCCACLARTKKFYASASHFPIHRWIWRIYTHTVLLTSCCEWYFSKMSFFWQEWGRGERGNSHLAAVGPELQWFKVRWPNNQQKCPTCNIFARLDHFISNSSCCDFHIFYYIVNHKRISS